MLRLRGIVNYGRGFASRGWRLRCYLLIRRIFTTRPPGLAQRDLEPPHSNRRSVYIEALAQSARLICRNPLIRSVGKPAHRTLYQFCRRMHHSQGLVLVKKEEDLLPELGMERQGCGFPAHDCADDGTTMRSADPPEQ